MEIKDKLKDKVSYIIKKGMMNKMIKDMYLDIDVQIHNRDGDEGSLIHISENQHVTINGNDN